MSELVETVNGETSLDLSLGGEVLKPYDALLFAVAVERPDQVLAFARENLLHSNINPYADLAHIYRNGLVPQPHQVATGIGLISIACSYAKGTIISSEPDEEIVYGLHLQLLGILINNEGVLDSRQNAPVAYFAALTLGSNPRFARYLYDDFNGFIVPPELKDNDPLLLLQRRYAQRAYEE